MENGAATERYHTTAHLLANVCALYYSHAISYCDSLEKDIRPPVEAKFLYWS